MEKRGLQKIREGQVVSNKMEKTVVVAITTKVKDRDYGKYVKQTKKYFVDDQKNECKVGDVVEIIETRPLSKNKRWRVNKIISHSVE